MSDAETPLESIDTLNRWGVAVQIAKVGGKAAFEVCLVKPTVTPMTFPEALVLAAWLVSIVGDDPLWERTLEAVRNA
ncbi:MAG: hypothetical protein H0U66_03120 [Gemmatimonadaceae bacterium]|nr:hypothetical protein [Gemmatimonadaceae bacterium]